ncbi:hypothetical protein G9A89_006344 [Geosiphon pyriformis]|nr:hypothetical protein G9A89_006344 [Geosiphon pyriformis]
MSFVLVNLLHVNAAYLFVYTDGSLSNLRTSGMMAGAAVFFKDIDLGLGVGVSGLVSSTIMELQTIALALKCIPSFYSVNLFLDSQVALNACKLESVLNLDVNWIKVKGYSGVFNNKHANALAKAAVFFNRHLSYIISEQFFQANDVTVSVHVLLAFISVADSKVAAQNIASFVHDFCLTFQDDIWLICTKHQTIMEKSGLILSDSSVSVSVSGLLVVFSAGVIRLLGIADVFGVSFGFCNVVLIDLNG